MQGFLAVPTGFYQFVFLGFLGGRGCMFTKTLHSLCLRLRNAVLNNLIHSYGASIIPRSRDSCQCSISSSDLSLEPAIPQGLLTGCFQWRGSNLTGPQVSSRSSPHPAPCLCPVTRARHWGCPNVRARPMLDSALNYLIRLSSPLHCRHCLSSALPPGCFRR